MFSFFISVKTGLKIYSQDILDVYEHWIELQQVYFIASLLLAFLILFSDKFIKIYFSISLLLAYFSFSNDLFDRHIHDFFTRSGFYNLIGFSTFSGNNQYAKLVPYVFILTLLTLLVTFVKSKRTFARFFIIILAGINLFTVFLNHKYFPEGILRNLVEFKIDEYKKFPGIPSTEFKIICERSGLVCRHVDNGKIIFDNANSFQMTADLKNQMQQLRNNSASLIDGFNRDVSRLGTLFVRANLKKEGAYYEIYNIDFIKYYWQLNIAYFSMSTFVVSLFWYYLVFILIAVHERIGNFSLKLFIKVLGNGLHKGR